MPAQARGLAAETTDEDEPPSEDVLVYLSDAREVGNVVMYWDLDINLEDVDVD